MPGNSLKPWSMAPAWTALAGVFLAFLLAIATLILLNASSLKASSVTRVLIGVLALSGVASAFSTLMWTRHWRHVAWETSFSAFVSGPPPEYPEALLAWRWGRRFRFSWVVTLVTMVAIVVIEVLAGRWR